MTQRFPALKPLLTAFLLLAVLVACQTTPPPTADVDRTLSVTVEGSGQGTVTSSPTGIDVSSGDDAATFDYTEGTEVTLTATAEEGSTFAGWSGACTGTDTCVLTMSANQSVTATFVSDDAEPVTLSVAVTGSGQGTVTSTPDGIDVSSGDDAATFDYTEGTGVTLTATAAEGSTFAGWSGACTGTDTCVLTMSANQSVTATFVSDDAEPVTLSVAVEGAGSGSVVSTPAGIDVSSGGDAAAFGFAEGTEVTLSATADAGSAFTGWTGDCTGTDSCVLLMDGDKSVTATFSPIDLSDYTLTVNTTGNGEGSVSSDPAGISIAVGETTDSAVFVADTSVTLTAAVAAGSAFAGWTGGGCSGTSLVCTLTILDDTTVTAQFFDVDTDVVTTLFTIQTGTDDAEEFVRDINEFYVAGGVQTGSTDLDLAWDAQFPSEMYVGLRYQDVTIPQGAVVTSATITFTRRAGGAGSVTLLFEGQNVDDAETFVDTGDGTASFGISGRARTDASAAWAITDAWGATAVTPNLANVVQAIVDRGGWVSGNALAFIISSEDSDADNYRRAQSYETQNGTAPVLSVTYYVPTAP